MNLSDEISPDPRRPPASTYIVIGSLGSVRRMRQVRLFWRPTLRPGLVIRGNVNT